MKAIYSRTNGTFPGRWFWLLIGLGLIIYSQALMHQRDLVSEVNPLLEAWNLSFRLDIVNIQNFGTAIPFLVIGGILSAFSISPYWCKQENQVQKTKYRGISNAAHLLPHLIISILLFTFLIFKLWHHEYTSILPWLWIFTLSLLTYMLYRYEKSVGANISPKITRVDLLWLTGLFLAGLVLGSFALQDIPNIMIPDEGTFWGTGRDIANGEHKPAFFDFGVYTFPVASSIFQGVVMRLFGVDMWGWRFASVLAGTFTVIPLYLLAKEWFDRRVAIMAVLFMLSNPYYLSFTRMGYNNSQSLFPVVLSLYFWSLGYKRSRHLYYWLAGLAAGVGFYTYNAAWLGLVTIVIVMIFLTANRRITFRQTTLTTVVFLTATAVTSGPRLIYGASSQDSAPLFHKLVETSFVNTVYGDAYYDPAELYPDGVSYLVGRNKIFYAPAVYVEMLTRSTVRTFAALFNPFIVTEHYITTNFSGGFLAALGLTLGLSLNLRTIKQTRSILLLTWFGAGLFFLSIISAFPPRQTHLVTIIPVLALLPAIGFAAIIDSLAEELDIKLPNFSDSWLQNGLLIIITILFVISGFGEYFVVMPLRNPPLFEDIVSWIAWRTEEPHTIIYVGSTDKKAPYRVEYLIKTRKVPHKYIGVTPNRFYWQEVSTKTIVFFDHQNDQQDKKFPAPPSSFKNSVNYIDKNGEPIGYAWANSHVNLLPASPIQIIREDLPYWTLPV